MNLEEGQLIYFTPFYYKNGAPCEPKFFVVLKNIDDSTIICSLPTSRSCIPSDIEIKQGCVEIPSGNICCFILEAGKSICQCGWSFDKVTYLNGQNIDNHELGTLQELSPTQDVDYKIIGVLNTDVFEAIIKCFKSSSSVKRKYQRVL